MSCLCVCSIWIEETPSCREASPGKLGAFEDDLFRNVEMADAPLAASLILGYTEGVRTVGVAFSDMAGRRLGACEFADDEYFCSTEAVLMQLGAKEVVLPKVGPLSQPSYFRRKLSLLVITASVLYLDNGH